jgi:uncharacterized protein
MSSHATTGSGDAIQAALNAIMRRLNSIEMKLEPLQPLSTHVEALEAVVTDQDRQQQELQDAVHRVKMTQSTPSGSHPPTHARRGAGDDEVGDAGHDNHTTAHKMEFPKFGRTSTCFRR